MVFDGIFTFSEWLVKCFLINNLLSQVKRCRARGGQKKKGTEQTDPKPIQIEPNYMSKPFGSRFYQPKWFGLV